MAKGSQTWNGAYGNWQFKYWIGTLFQLKAVLVAVVSVSAIQIRQTSFYLQLL